MQNVRRKHVAVEPAADAADEGPAMQFAQTLLDLVSEIPAARERAQQDPDDRAGQIIRAAKRKAALASATLALPPGPLGWLTLLPELYAVWKIQAQMVSDLAALHGRKSQLSREQMLYCLFRHTGAQLFRDLILRVGERYIVQRLPIRSLYSIANKIGIRLTQRGIGRAVSRVVPVAGALGVGAYSWYDTRQVARTAMELFSHEIDVLPIADAEVISSTRTRQVPAKRATAQPKPAGKTSTARKSPPKKRAAAAKKAPARRTAAD